MPTKKKTKKTKKIQSEITVAKLASFDPKPPIQEGSFSMELRTDEILSAIQILAFSVEIFDKMSRNCEKDGDLVTAEAYLARSQLSALLYEKFKTVAEIGEPTSREVH